MKRILALLLSLVLIIGMSACGQTSGTSSAAPASSTAPASSAAPAGGASATEVPFAQGTFIGISAYLTGNEQAMGVVNAVKSYLDGKNCKTQLTDANGDTATQISNIENFVTQGAKFIIVLTMDPDTLKDACVNAEKAGTHIFYMGMQPSYYTEISACQVIPYYKIGYALGQMVLKWVDKTFPEAGQHSLPLAESKLDMYVDGKAMTDAFEACLAKDGRVYIDYQEQMKDITSETGFNFVQNALTYNKDIKLFFIYNNGMSAGCDEYVISNKLDLSKICMVSSGASESAQAMVDKSNTNESTLRGFIGYGAADMGAYSGQIIANILTGNTPKGSVIYDPSYVVNSLGYDFAADIPTGP